MIVSHCCSTFDVFNGTTGPTGPELEIRTPCATTTDRGDKNNGDQRPKKNHLSTPTTSNLFISLPTMWAPLQIVNLVYNCNNYIWLMVLITIVFGAVKTAYNSGGATLYPNNDGDCTWIYHSNLVVFQGTAPKVDKQICRDSCQPHGLCQIQSIYLAETSPNITSSSRASQTSSFANDLARSPKARNARE